MSVHVPDQLVGAAPRALDEPTRLTALRSYQVLDTAPEQAVVQGHDRPGPAGVPAQ